MPKTISVVQIANMIFMGVRVPGFLEVQAGSGDA
jgi:hypothetical protein